MESFSKKAFDIIYIVDPGNHGAICCGTCIADFRLIAKGKGKPQTAKDYINFFSKLSLLKDVLLVIERIPYTNARNPGIGGGWKKYVAQSREDAFWEVVAEACGDYWRLYPGTWRKAAFGKATLPLGYTNFHEYEKSQAVKLFPHLDWGKWRMRNPISDNPIYGQSACCGIFIAALTILKNIKTFAKRLLGK